MKKICFLLTFFAITTSLLLSQVSQKMSYQAIIRDAGNSLVANHGVGMRISILQGSPTGTAVYVETQNVSTNANGLLTLEIGNGTPVSGTFSSINWSTGTYFLKTETDPYGGTSYTISGTSQFLSVPYALFANKAGNGFSGIYSDLTGKPTLFDGAWTSLTGKPLFATIATSGSYNDLLNKPTLFNGTWASLTGKPTTISGYGITDAFDGTWASLTSKPTTISGYGITDAFNGTWASLTGKPAFATVATSGSFNDLSNTPIINGSETRVTAGTNVTITGIGTTASPYVVNATAGSATAHYIGEFYGGGIVYYITPDGYHGLIAETQDQSAGCNWYAAQDVISTSTNHSTEGMRFTDWRLPTKNELNLLYLQKVAGVVNGFTADTHYWSSTEDGQSAVAWFQNFGDGTQYGYGFGFKSAQYRIRSIRSF